MLSFALMLAAGLQQHTNYDWQSSKVLNTPRFGYIDVHSFNKRMGDKALFALKVWQGFSIGLTVFPEMKKLFVLFGFWELHLHNSKVNHISYWGHVTQPQKLSSKKYFCFSYLLSAL